jgi:putative transposase
MDNAPVHNKKQIRESVEAEGHKLLCLPRYSQDMSEIEPTFGTMKKRRCYLPPGAPVDALFLLEIKME